MGSYVSVENDIDDAKEVLMKYSANEIGLIFAAFGGIALLATAAIVREAGKHGFNRVGSGCQYKSDKLTLSLVCQINIIVIKEIDGRPRVYRGKMTTWSGATDGATRYYKASDIPLKEY